MSIDQGQETYDRIDTICRQVHDQSTEIAILRRQVEYMVGIIQAISQGIQGIGQMSGPQAMMLKAMGLPIDMINSGIDHVEQQYQG